MQVRIKKCEVLADYRLMTPLFIESWQEQYGFCKYDRDSAARLWLIADQAVYIFILNARPIAYIAIQGNDEIIELTNIFVIKESRRKGIGKELLDCVLTTHAEIVLWVHEHNKPALNFYRRMGFSISGETKADLNHREKSLMLKMKRMPNAALT